MRIEPREVEAVANLARLYLDAHAQEKVREDLATILEYVARLDEADVSGIAPLYNPAETEENVMRRDEVAAWAIRDRFLEASPARHGDFVAVPRFAGDWEERHG